MLSTHRYPSPHIHTLARSLSHSTNKKMTGFLNSNENRISCFFFIRSLWNYCNTLQCFISILFFNLCLLIYHFLIQNLQWFYSIWRLTKNKFRQLSLLFHSVALFHDTTYQVMANPQQQNYSIKITNNITLENNTHREKSNSNLAIATI